jgi:hypothetical protein
MYQHKIIFESEKQINLYSNFESFKFSMLFYKEIAQLLNEKVIDMQTEEVKDAVRCSSYLCIEKYNYQVFPLEIKIDKKQNCTPTLFDYLVSDSGKILQIIRIEIDAHSSCSTYYTCNAPMTISFSPYNFKLYLSDAFLHNKKVWK